MDDDTRRQLCNWARRRRSRNAEFSRSRPTHWDPYGVSDPRELGSTFTDDSAWEFIAELLEKETPVEEILLERPSGKTAYVMKVLLSESLPMLYIKIQCGSGCVIGRSFHYSTRPNK